MAGIPTGMNPNTFEYLINFTMAHEGETPFMYNNWPLKNSVRDVTVGVGIALFSEQDAVRPDIRRLFRVKSTGAPASDDDMRREFRRVYDLPRTAGNLFSDYRDKSPLQIPTDEMRRSLIEKMLSFWDQNGQSFPMFSAIPAQAQAALMSYNYGARLRAAPKMCNAVRAGNFTLAAQESHVPGWDGQKNEGHKRLLMNAATIVREGMDATTLPPIAGPFKPPPVVLGGNNSLPGSPTGLWNVRVDVWLWVYSFDSRGGVRWTDPYNKMTGGGTWKMVSNSLVISWASGSRETWDVPLNLSNTSGSCFMSGSGRTFPLTAVKQN